MGSNSLTILVAILLLGVVIRMFENFQLLLAQYPMVDIRAMGFLSSDWQESLCGPPLTKTVEKRKDGVVCTHLINTHKNCVCTERSKDLPLLHSHHLYSTWLYLLHRFTAIKVKSLIQVYTKRWSTFKVHHSSQSTWHLHLLILYTDIKYSCLYIHIGEIASFVDILLATELYTKRIIPIKSTLFFFPTVQSYTPFFPHFVIQSWHFHVKIS